MMPGLLIHGGVLVLMAAVAIAAVQSRKTMVVTILLAMFSLLMAAMYLLLEAPDVAMTEAAVGAGISTLVIVATLLHTGRHDDVPRKGRKAVLVLVACIGAVLAMAMHDLPHIGDVNAPVIRRELPGGTPSTNGYYLDATQRDIAIPNVVTAVLASYRAYDTLGETAVVFTAMLAVLLILWPGLQRLLGGPKGGDHA